MKTSLICALALLFMAGGIVNAQEKSTKAQRKEQKEAQKKADNLQRMIDVRNWIEEERFMFYVDSQLDNNRMLGWRLYIYKEMFYSPIHGDVDFSYNVTKDKKGNYLVTVYHPLYKANSLEMTIPEDGYNCILKTSGSYGTGLFSGHLEAFPADFKWQEYNFKDRSNKNMNSTLFK